MSDLLDSWERSLRASVRSEATISAYLTDLRHLAKGLATSQGVVAFVASAAAWHMNGADVAVDGGTLDA